jgi:hypothetical protein
MPFHLLNYGVLGGVNDANVDMTAAVDTVFTARNNHYIFSEPYNIIAMAALGANMTRVRSNIPTWNAIGRHMIHPIRRSATIPDLPAVQDLRDFPLSLPQNEEVAWEESPTTWGPPPKGRRCSSGLPPRTGAATSPGARS